MYRARAPLSLPRRIIAIPRPTICSLMPGPIPVTLLQILAPMLLSLLSPFISSLTVGAALSPIFTPSSYYLLY